MKNQPLLSKALSKSVSSLIIGIGIVINSDGQVLIDQRKNNGSFGGLWEFPGGKQEIGEDIRTTISRELKEELSIEVSVEEELISFDHSYSNQKLSFHVYICKLISGSPKSIVSQQVLWVEPKDLVRYPFPAANSKMILSLNQHLIEDKIKKNP